MKLVYRGTGYDQQEQAQIDRQWWNMAHRPWLVLKYRGLCYFPYVTGGQVPLIPSTESGTF